MILAEIAWNFSGPQPATPRPESYYCAAPCPMLTAIARTDVDLSTRRKFHSSIQALIRRRARRVQNGAAARRNRARVATTRHQESGLAGRYATAIFELATGHRNPSTRSRLISPRCKIADAASPDLARLVRSPVFGRDEQAKAHGGRARQDGRHRAHHANSSCCSPPSAACSCWPTSSAPSKRMVARQRGEVQAEVTSARALSDGEIDRTQARAQSQARPRAAP